MTPGTLNIPIYRGAAWRHTLRFLQSGTTTPLDLSGLGPFVMQFSDTSGRILASATVTVDTPSSGIMDIALTATQTQLFPIGSGMVRVGIRDSLNNPYAQGNLDVIQFTPRPA